MVVFVVIILFLVIIVSWVFVGQITCLFISWCLDYEKLHSGLM